MRFAPTFASVLMTACVSGCSPSAEPSKVVGPASVGGDRPEGSLAGRALHDAGGRRFDLLGRSLDGGSNLRPLAGYNQFWFAWSVFNHGSAVFPGGTVETAPLEGDGECAVPCDRIRLGCPGLDCIPALTRPEAVAASDAAADYLTDDAWVVGVSAGGEARAYPHNLLWWHEIVNDEVGGVPVAVTHCPLTFSSLGHDPTRFVTGKTVELGVSGRLLNSNLVFYNREDDTWFSQLLGVGTKGAALGAEAPRTHVWEMSWGAWKAMFPQTTVLTEATGHARNYERYPYRDYFTDHGNTFAPTEPSPDPSLPNKTLTYGLRVDGAAKAYPHPALRTHAGAAMGVVNDRVGDEDVLIVFDLDAGYVQAFSREGLGEMHWEAR